MSEVEVLIGGGEAEVRLRSLQDWLRADETLNGSLRARLAVSGPADTEAMGFVFDVLELAIGSGLSAGALAVSILQWRQAQRVKRELTLRRGDVEVRIPVGDAADEELVGRIVALLDEDLDEDGDERRSA
ncbi:hypothetical protein E1265_34770 [Streptomyces sp. 8K308]|uniref:effector-associated constant component EACC1 n=1 Tax=Streptomyces sp. 8K308 TaxID=2530388 RepID=UPI00105060D4|nr:hypothetical protein [Streptomyces sp. 8K308]TDC06423.1 hypothetical protein E1265_34770 [Streptomyces sp. 8K308]